MPGALPYEKRADQRDKEHQVAGQRENHAQPVADQQFPWAVVAIRVVAPVFAVASAAGRTPV
jgi:hypothetical protein